MSTLAAYRARIPGHAMVPDAFVQTYLDDAIAAHTYAAWGAVYDAAMVCWAASRIEPLRVAGQAGELDAKGNLCGPQTTAEGAPLTPPKPEETVFWAQYLDYRKGRAAAAPRLVSACG